MKDGLVFRANKPAGFAWSFDEMDRNYDRLMYFSGLWDVNVTYTQHEVVWYRGGVYYAINDVALGKVPSTDDPDWGLLAYMPNQAFLFGGAASINPGASYTAITGWVDSQFNGEFADLPPTASTGIISAPIGGDYRITYNLVLEQNNSNKELAIVLELRLIGGTTAGDTIINALQVSDDKTDIRAFTGSFNLPLEAGQQCQLGLSRVNQSIGNSAWVTTYFELQLELPLEGDF